MSFYTKIWCELFTKCLKFMAGAKNNLLPSWRAVKESVSSWHIEICIKDMKAVVNYYRMSTALSSDPLFISFSLFRFIEFVQQFSLWKYLFLTSLVNNERIINYSNFHRYFKGTRRRFIRLFTFMDFTFCMKCLLSELWARN